MDTLYIKHGLFVVTGETGLRMTRPKNLNKMQRNRRIRSKEDLGLPDSSSILLVVMAMGVDRRHLNSTSRKLI